MTAKRFTIQLQKLRKALKMTQADLAFSVGVDGSFISKLERGVSSPTLEMIYKLAAALDVPVEELIK